MNPTFEIKEEINESNYGKFVITPLLAGYGNTLATALRRVLLTSLPGASITTVQIKGVKHQFTTLKGMREDVLDFLLNLKKVNFRYNGETPVKATLNVNSAGEVKAGDIEVSSEVTIANPELVLANLAKGATLSAELTIEAGVGYSLASDRPNEAIGVIPLDASFSPVTRVTPKIEETRVGRVTNYDKLTLEIWTTGAISPQEALTSAAKILVAYFQQIVNPVSQPIVEAVTISDDSLGTAGKLSVEEIGLPTRVANALAKAGFETVEKLVNAPKEELMKVRNLGEKSLDVIREALNEKGVDLKYA